MMSIKTKVARLEKLETGYGNSVLADNNGSKRLE